MTFVFFFKTRRLPFPIPTSTNRTCKISNPLKPQIQVGVLCHLSIGIQTKYLGDDQLHLPIVRTTLIDGEPSIGFRRSSCFPSIRFAQCPTIRRTTIDLFVSNARSSTHQRRLSSRYVRSWSKFHGRTHWTADAELQPQHVCSMYRWSER